MHNFVNILKPTELYTLKGKLDDRPIEKFKWKQRAKECRN